MGFHAGQPIAGTKIDVAFVGSCTNGRLSDLRVAAEIARGRKVARGVRALIVPGSQEVARAAEAEGLHEIFEEAGFQWRKAGCSMCLGMNEDKLQGREVSASSSNRNFKGRQGSPTGRTLLMSPAMVAAAAIAGAVTDVREMPQGRPAMSATSERRQVTGGGSRVPGNDIDTDRIIPARHLKSVTFEGLGEHVFGDERKAVPEHPFNRPQFQGASILITGQNFGCGSSREHAPQVLRDWGVGGIVAGSFGEIFFGNCTAIGIPCLSPTRPTSTGCSARSRSTPIRPVELDVERHEVRFSGRIDPGQHPRGRR